MTMQTLHSKLIDADLTEVRIAALNDCAPEVAILQFRRCCGSSKWVDAMSKARPYSGLAALEECADRAWAACSEGDWLEAFKDDTDGNSVHESFIASVGEGRPDSGPATEIRNVAEQHGRIIRLRLRQLIVG
jgi:hypothetical protein